MLYFHRHMDLGRVQRYSCKGPAGRTTAPGALGLPVLLHLMVPTSHVPCPAFARCPRSHVPCPTCTLTPSRTPRRPAAGRCYDTGTPCSPKLTVKEDWPAAAPKTVAVRAGGSWEGQRVNSIINPSGYGGGRGGLTIWGLECQAQRYASACCRLAPARLRGGGTSNVPCLHFGLVHVAAAMF